MDQHALRQPLEELPQLVARRAQRRHALLELALLTSDTAKRVAEREQRARPAAQSRADRVRRRWNEDQAKSLTRHEPLLDRRWRQVEELWQRDHVPEAHAEHRLRWPIARVELGGDDQ